MNLREEIKYIVDEYFEFEFDSKQLPLTRIEFIDTLEDRFRKLLTKYKTGDVETSKDSKPKDVDEL